MQRSSLGGRPLVLRYIGAGLWNTLFAWLAFAVIWNAGESFAPLWLLAIIAHLVATTQSFLVQRKWVFRPEAGSMAVQFARFQLVYLGLLGIGLLMLQALNAQGVHPLAAQVLVMAAQAFSGFVLGRSFTFSSERFSLGQLLNRIVSTPRNHATAWLVFALSLLVFHEALSKPFYASLDHVGHDFALSATGLLEGRFWLQSNGLVAGLFNPPWFTPAWCAGAAFFADPQAGFYSPLQWFALVLDPFQAMQVATLLFAALAFWGSYALARRVFRWGTPAAVVFAVLGMANTFMPLRSAVGESGYQPLYLWVLLVLALCWPADPAAGWRHRLAGPSLAVGVILTAWLHFGFAGMMVPTFLGAILLCLVLILTGRARLEWVLARATLGGVLAIALNSSKLYEASSLMRNFPRDFYAMPGFASLRDALVAPFMALLLPSEWTAHFGERRLSDARFAVLPHEWALEFGLGALAVALAAAAVLLWLRHRNKDYRSSASVARVVWNTQTVCATLMALTLVVIPPLLLWNQGAVRDALKQIPILNSAAWPMRWIVIYLPLAQWLLAWPVQQVLARQTAQRQWIWAALAAAGIWLGPVMAPVGYYLDPGIQSYDPKPVLQAHAQSRLTGQPIPIERVEVAPPHMLGASRNDTMLQGASQGLCYNPIYGYRLEAFPQIERLASGPALSTDASGQSLIFNPACLVHPQANACRPGDGFRMNDAAQRQAAEHFVARRPFDWQRPWLGRVCSWVSQAAFWVLLSLLVSWLWLAVLAALRPRAGDTGL